MTGINFVTQNMTIEHDEQYHEYLILVWSVYYEHDLYDQSLQPAYNNK